MSEMQSCATGTSVLDGSSKVRHASKALGRGRVLSVQPKLGRVSQKVEAVEPKRGNKVNDSVFITDLEGVRV